MPRLSYKINLRLFHQMSQNFVFFLEFGNLVFCRNFGLNLVFISLLFTLDFSISFVSSGFVNLTKRKKENYFLFDSNISHHATHHKSKKKPKFVPFKAHNFTSVQCYYEGPGNKIINLQLFYLIFFILFYFIIFLYIYFSIF